MFLFLNAAARSALGLTVGALLVAVALPAGAALSARAISYGGNLTAGGPPASTTEVASEVVSQSGSGESRYFVPPSFDKVVLGTVSGSASASVDYGVNRIALNTGVIDLRSQAGTNPYNYTFGYVSGLAESLWFDRWNIGGGAPGDLVSISVSGRTTYQFAVTGIAGITDTPAFNVNQVFSVSTRPDAANVALDTADFVNNAGAGYVDWSLTFNGTVGVPVDIYSNFYATSDCCYDLSIGTRDYDVTYSFESMNTSRLQRIELPSGYTLSANSGEIVAYDGDFAYRAALVPEPQTWASLLVGLVALCWRVRPGRA